MGSQYGFIFLLFWLFQGQSNSTPVVNVKTDAEGNNPYAEIELLSALDKLREYPDGIRYVFKIINGELQNRYPNGRKINSVYYTEEYQAKMRENLHWKNRDNQLFICEEYEALLTRDYPNISDEILDNEKIVIRIGLDDFVKEAPSSVIYHSNLIEYVASLYEEEISDGLKSYTRLKISSAQLLAELSENFTKLAQSMFNENPHCLEFSRLEGCCEHRWTSWRMIRVHPLCNSESLFKDVLWSRVVSRLQLEIVLREWCCFPAKEAEKALRLLPHSHLVELINNQFTEAQRFFVDSFFEKIDSLEENAISRFSAYIALLEFLAQWHAELMAFNNYRARFCGALAAPDGMIINSAFMASQILRNSDEYKFETYPLKGNPTMMANGCTVFIALQFDQNIWRLAELMALGQVLQDEHLFQFIMDEASKYMAAKPFLRSTENEILLKLASAYPLLMNEEGNSYLGFCQHLEVDKGQ